MTADASPPFDRLDVLDDLTPRNARLNMAVDEVLLGNLSETPLLRIYRWARPSVSFGYFTPWMSVVANYPQRDGVRRWTGGGVVEHGEDVTYSLLVPRSHPLTNGRAGESYRVIHAALQRALISLGWEQTGLSEEDNGPAEIASHACFASPVRHDLLFAGQKVGGGAQRRTRHGLLHQGSVRRDGSFQLDAGALAQALPAAFARRSRSRSLFPEAAAAAERLAEEKYGNVRWLQRV